MTDATPREGCRHCGAPLVRKRSGPPPTYCSGACRAATKYQRDKSTGKDREYAERAKAKAAAERLANARPCPYCGDPMTSTRRVQCGAPECKRTWMNERQRAWFQEYKKKTGERYNARFASQVTRPRYLKTCEHCDKQWTSWNPESRYCSHECWVRARRAPHAQLTLRSLPPWWIRRPLPNLPSPLRRRWYVGRCMACGDWFIHDQPATRTCSKVCSRRVQRRLGKDKRRALERDAFVARVDRRTIFERDRWTCQLCGKRVRRTAEVPHPKAPVLDHIVPLADHGTHEPSNVQCAHFLCNSIKGARGGGEQLMIFG